MVMVIVDVDGGNQVKFYIFFSMRLIKDDENVGNDDDDFYDERISTTAL